MNVREMEYGDIENIVAYWMNSGEEHFARMGVHKNKVPSESVFKEVLSASLFLPVAEKKLYYIIWEDEEKAVGHCNLNPVHYGVEGYMHLHLWRTEMRQKGMGTQFVKMSIPFFFENLRIEKLYCQPNAFNVAPNKTLEKTGFEFLEKYRCVPGPMNFEQEVNKWVLTRDRYLEVIENGVG